MKNKIILCDLDGTLANIEHRLHLIDRKCKTCGGFAYVKEWGRCVNCPDCKTGKVSPNWPAFFKACVDDTPIQTTIRVILHLWRGGFEVWITSGRSDEVRAETMNWLNKNDVPVDKLIMRPAGDYTADDTLKQRWLDDGTIPKDRVFCVFDDRKRVVDMWRNNGLVCYQVADGEF